MDQSIHPEPCALSEVEGHLAEATTELFDAYGISLRRVRTEAGSGTDRGITVTATIGFAGENLRGALVVSASQEAIRRWQLQIGNGESAIGTTADTIGEFSNMLLGRLKYSLLLRGVTILLATPTIAMGQDITLPPASGRASRCLWFDGEVGRVDVRVDVSFAADFVFAAEAPQGAHSCAGDMMMF